MCINCNDPLQINLVQGPAGPIGPAPGITATASTGAVGVSVTGPTSGNYNLAFSIPAGASGSNGTNGVDGAYGGVSFPYTYGGPNSTQVDPGAGYIRFNGVSGPGVSMIHISNANKAALSYFSFGLNLYQTILFGVNNTIKGLIKVFNKTNPNVYGCFQIDSVVNQGGTWTTFNVTNIGYNGSLSTNDEVLVSFSVAGSSTISNLSTLSIEQLTPPVISSMGNVSYNNSFLTPSNGATMCTTNTTVYSSNSTALATSTFSTATGTWSCTTAGYYQFHFYASLTWPVGSTNGWYSSANTPQAIMAGIIGTGSANSGSIYCGTEWICPTNPTRQAVFSASSQVVYINPTSGTSHQFQLKINNMCGIASNGTANDAVKWSITRFS